MSGSGEFYVSVVNGSLHPHRRMIRRRSTGASVGSRPQPVDAYQSVAQTRGTSLAGLLLAELLASTGPWRGGDAQLLHEAGKVSVVPVLHDLAFCERLPRIPLKLKWRSSAPW